ncbi:hypothetical protein HPB52_010034 [Rhipicephalus sanguineus]|uniref:Uncharacterized protein n=1 Tax=Rhipicephalus sanguineus TaxID=34632 RepID=A0A9D4PI76_RHISA|nr:hypothetical protein HPB52_010034 [Rhipicephalus sanguineus]
MYILEMGLRSIELKTDRGARRCTVRVAVKVQVGTVRPRVARRNVSQKVRGDGGGSEPGPPPPCRAPAL